MKRIKTYIQISLFEAVHRLLQKVFNNGMPVVEAKVMVSYNRRQKAVSASGTVRKEPR